MLGSGVSNCDSLDARPEQPTAQQYREFIHMWVLLHQLMPQLKTTVAENQVIAYLMWSSQYGKLEERIQGSAG